MSDSSKCEISTLFKSCSGLDISIGLWDTIPSVRGCVQNVAFGMF